MQLKDKDSVKFIPNETKINSQPKSQQRLIAKMVAYSLLGVTTASLIGGGYVGIKSDIIKNEIKELNQQKIETKEPSQIAEIDAKINKLTTSYDKHVDVLMPTVYTFLGSGVAGYTTALAIELKEDKKKKLAEQTEETVLFK